MTPEVRAKWSEAWAEARKAKDRRRKENREKWAKRRDWSDDKEATAPVLPQIAADDPPDSGGFGSLAKLRAIMLDQTAPLYRRLDAADVVIDYELAPGAAVDTPAEQIASTAFQFFKAVDVAEDAPEALKFRALKAIPRIENTRKAAVASSTQHRAKRELHVRLVNMARSRALREAGVWSAAIESGARWSLDASDDFDMPEPPRLSLGLPPEAGFGARLTAYQALPEDEQRRLHEAQNAELLAVRARNRPDDWERLLNRAAAD